MRLVNLTSAQYQTLVALASFYRANIENAEFLSEFICTCIGYDTSVITSIKELDELLETLNSKTDMLQPYEITTLVALIDLIVDLRDDESLIGQFFCYVISQEYPYSVLTNIRELTELVHYVKTLEIEEVESLGS